MSYGKEMSMMELAKIRSFIDSIQHELDNNFELTRKRLN